MEKSGLANSNSSVNPSLCWCASNSAKISDYRWIVPKFDWLRLYASHSFLTRDERLLEWTCEVKHSAFSESQP